MAARGEPPLSDSDLRNELKRLGFTPGPITPSTRGVLLKKYESLKNAERKNSRAPPVSKRISSPKIFGLSSDESDGETAGNSRGTAPATSARRRSGARVSRTAPATKRLSVGGKIPVTSRKTTSRRSLPAPTTTYSQEDDEEDDVNGADNGSDANGLSSTSGSRHQTASRLMMGGGKTVNNDEREDHRPSMSRGEAFRTSKGIRRKGKREKGEGDQLAVNVRHSAFRSEFSDSDGETLARRSVRDREKLRKGKASARSTNSEVYGARNRITERRSYGISSHDRGEENEDDEENEEDDNDEDAEHGGDSARPPHVGNTDTYRRRSNVSSPNDTYESGTGRWSFLTRKTSAKSSSRVAEGNNETASSNWTFLSLPFNSSRTSTPRKANADDTLYHTITGNSIRQDNSANPVAAPVSSRDLSRSTPTTAHHGNHSFLGQTPVTGNSAPKQEEEMDPNRAFASRNDSLIPPDDQAGDETQEFATEENLGSSWRTKYGHFVSLVLLGSVCLFFLLLGLMYLSVNSTGKSGLLQIDDIAGGDDVDFSGDEFALLMVQALHVKLSEMTGNFLCGKSVLRNMSRDEIKIYLEEKQLDSKTRRRPYLVDETMPRMFDLITKNPQWGLRLFDKDRELIPEYKFDDGVAWLDSSHAHMTMFCQVKTTALRLIFWASVIIIGLLVLWPCLYLLTYLLQRKEQERREVTQLVERIIEVLANHQKACYQDKSLTPYLAIPHVRDTLIPLAERHKKQHLWQKAVQFLNVNESRVRVETQQVAGEEFAVWRWVQPSPAVAVTSFSPITERDMNPKRAKVWQGTAFANLDTAVKASAYSYTPCLKVRNMFDPTLESGSNWHVAIQDAILERCGENSGIVHIAVDKNSREGCVYVKCVSSEKAGMAFRCLQGSWFDGKLVTVKYIRLDRYHQRFPSAFNSNTPLQPSNNLCISLQPLPAGSN
ncbi:uncharacterized protein [Diadema setosum]|uniref:uncharacterized protein n=1 Tax=Diadema setosum TaxID=31175 RepID=UPI003B3BADA4